MTTTWTCSRRGGCSAPVAGLGRPSDDTGTDVLVVACGNESKRGRRADRVVVGIPRPSAVVLCQSSANGFVGRAFAAGADDLIVLEPGPQASRRATMSSRVAQGSRAQGHAWRGDTSLATMICVLGPKGGTARRWSLATSRSTLAVVVARRRGRSRPPVRRRRASLGLRPERTIYDLATSGGSLRRTRWTRSICHHSGLRVLAGADPADQTGASRPSPHRRAHGVATAKFDFATTRRPSFSPEVIAAVDLRRSR